MAEGKVVAYYRVSTAKQGTSGLGLEAQRSAVSAYLDGGHWQLLQEFTEVESGTDDARPRLRAALDYAELTGATLVVAKLDRLSRNAAFLNSLMDSVVPIKFADMPFADRFIIGIMAQVAQWEAEQISKRTREALAATKAKGSKLGGDRGNLAEARVLGCSRSAVARKEKSTKRAQQVMPHVEAARAAGHTTLAAIASYLNGLHITTARGGRWHPASVARLLDQ